MKKILAIILVVLTVSLFCCSCGSEEMGFGEETTKSVTLYPYTDYEKKLEGVSGIGVYTTMLKIQYADGTTQTFHNVPYVIE